MQVSREFIYEGETHCYTLAPVSPATLVFSIGAHRWGPVPDFSTLIAKVDGIDTYITVTDNETKVSTRELNPALDQMLLLTAAREAILFLTRWESGATKDG